MVDRDACPLCNLDYNRRTHWYVAQRNWYYVIDCDTCGTPMIVQAMHGPGWIPRMLGEAVDVCTRIFDLKTLCLRFERRKVKNHAHVHLVLPKNYDLAAVRARHVVREDPMHIAERVQKRKDRNIDV